MTLATFLEWGSGFHCNSGGCHVPFWILVAMGVALILIEIYVLFVVFKDGAG